MSGQPVSTAQHPPHGHPDNTEPSTQAADKPSTSSHPPTSKPDPTENAAQRRLSPAATSSSSELASLKIRLRQALRTFPDFPTPGILFEDILPIFANPDLHEALVRALELHIIGTYGAQKPDIVVGLEARGFLFGPSLALRIGAGFVPVRKKGKVPGPTVTASFQKEYGEDFFQMQKDAFKPGQRVLIVDDIIATGKRTTAINGYFRLTVVVQVDLLLLQDRSSSS